MVGWQSGDRTVDRLGGAIVLQGIEPILRRTRKELAARDAQPLCSPVDTMKGLIRKRDRCLHATEYNPVIPRCKCAAALVRYALRHELI